MKSKSKVDKWIEEAKRLNDAYNVFGLSGIHGMPRAELEAAFVLIREMAKSRKEK